ncbi:MAG TPA: VWA domain-containing protein [candidate division Zixibacteria bacterium]|nr:VWA domain-containing protein [Candidatus Acidoferrales bacterium]HVP65408.1 VWA domain-containing protein [candidate division Zixibacteria bacterium]
MKRAFLIAAIIVISGAVLWAQQPLPDGPTPQPDAGQQQSAPEAPAPSKLPLPTPSPQDTKMEPPTTPNSDVEQPQKTQPPPPAINTVPSGSAPKTQGNGPEQLLTFTSNVNFVQFPVRVKDSNGHDVPGLTMDNFTVYENDQKVPIKYFTSDPFPLSAAVILDVGMAEITLKKVQESFPALIGAFSQYDEVSLYTYGNTVRQQQDYLAATSDKTSQTFSRVTGITGRNAGAPVYNPMTVGPTVNGRVFDQGQQRSINAAPPKNEEPSRVLNDAILRAAFDLGKRPRGRRKIIFIISDGREIGSNASYSDVLRLLLTSEISVYAIAVDTGAMPIYNKLGKIRLPRQGVTNILPKYASATGGEVFSELNQNSMESAYASATQEARNQYTLGYNSPTPFRVSASYRTIEVRVNQPGLKVYAKTGYYPLPPRPTSASEKTAPR